MSPNTYDENRSFIYFLILIIATSFIFVFEGLYDKTIGILGIIWGIYGFFRLVHLTASVANPPYILSLPAQLLFGLAKQQEEKILVIVKRLSQQDVVLWFSGAVVFIVLAIAFSIFPSEITVMKTLQLEQETLLDFSVSGRTDPYLLMKGVSSYAVLGLVVLSALSYSQSRSNIHWSLLFLFPVFLTGAALHVILSPLADPVLWPDLSIMRGGGFGQSDVMHLLVPDVMKNSGTGLMARFTEFGMLGAYGTYMLFIPAVLIMIEALFNRACGYLKPVAGLFCFGVLVVLDMFWIMSPMALALQVIGLALGALCWGACCTDRKTLTKEQK